MIMNQSLQVLILFLFYETVKSKKTLSLCEGKARVSPMFPDESQ